MTHLMKHLSICYTIVEQVHESARGSDFPSIHIVELSEIIAREVGSNTWLSSAANTTIFHVPKETLQQAHAAGDKSRYQPSFLSIGPYYYGDKGTAEMRRNEQGKLWWLGFMLREGGGRPTVLDYIEAVASMEAVARSCYEGDVGMDRDAFCRMLLLDACQLIQLLRWLGGAAATATGGGGSTNPPSSHHGSWKWRKWLFRGARCLRWQQAAVSSELEVLPTSNVTEGSHGSTQEAGAGEEDGAERRVKTRDMCMTVHDLIMLENQIPFFVVEKIYELSYGDATAVRRLAWEALRAEFMGGVPPAPGHRCCSQSEDNGDDSKVQHLLHLCHLYLKPTCLVKQPPESGHQRTGKYARFRRATEYYEAGVKFRRWPTVAEEAAAGGGGGSHAQWQRPMLDVAFTNGVLSMALHIDEKTGYILANVLAYEQKYYLAATRAGSSYVTAYVVFMSQLLGSPEDVALLSSRGVIEHHLGTDAEVCALFRGLADGLFFDPDGEHYLSPVGVALLRHCRYRPNRWRAWVVRHHFSNPWLVAAWVFGASVVICTIIQTVFAVLSYVKGG